jgi:50S ribosomal protein L16 3-hydroxylase
MGDLARELLVRMSEEAEGSVGTDLYQDAQQPAVQNAAAIPEGLADFAKSALQRALKDPHALARALGEYLTEPKANVWFEGGAVPRIIKAVALDRRSRMMYDKHHIFLNGESWRAAGADARLMRLLADQRMLTSADLKGASSQAVDLLKDWCEDGWLKVSA